MWSDGSLSVMTSLAFDGTIIVVAPLGATTARRRRTKSQGRRCKINDACGALPQSQSHSHSSHTHSVCVLYMYM